MTKTSSNRTFRFSSKGSTGTFNLEFETVEEGGWSAGGDSDHQSTLSFYIQQLDDVTTSPHGDGVSIKFHGPWEFGDFHRAIALLAQELTKTYGDPLSQREKELLS